MMPIDLAVDMRICLTFPARVLSITGEIEAMLGYTLADFVDGGIDLAGCIHHDDADIAQLLFSAEHASAGSSLNFRLRHVNGSIRCIKGHYSKQGDANAMQLALRLEDVRNLWQAASDTPCISHFNAMMRASTDYIYFKDRNHVFTAASDSLVAVTPGVNYEQQLLGLTDYDIYAESVADFYYGLEKQIFAGKAVVDAVQEILLEDGRSCWIDYRKSPLKNADGDIIGVFGIARDISEQKLAEQVLRLSEQRLQQIQLVAGIGRYTLDIASGQWQSCAVLKQLLGIEEDYDHSASGWHALLHKDDRFILDNNEHCVARITQLGQHVNYDQEYRIIRHSDQTEIWLRGRGELEFDDQGLPWRISGTMQDLSLQRQEQIVEQRALLSNQLIAIAAVRNRKIIWANTAFENMFGYDSAELIGLHARRFYKKEQDYQAVGAVYDEIAINDSKHFECELLRKDSRPLWVDMRASMLQITEGETLWAFTDITARKLDENELLIAATAFESHDGIMVTDAYNNILRVNAAFSRLTGYSAAEVIGKSPEILSSGRHGANFYAAMWHGVNSTGTWEGEIWNRRKNGEIYPQYMTITAVSDRHGKLNNYVASMVDITTKKEAEADLQQLAFYDSLTRLPNRRLLVDKLNLALAASTHNGKDGALLFINLDRFKQLNDSLGHEVGDLLLLQVAERLVSCVREGDTVARQGGDEYLVMLEDLSTDAEEAAAQAELIGEKILIALSQPYQLAMHDYFITASIGVAQFSNHSQSQEELMKHADIAMHQSKKSGRNTLSFFDIKMQELISARVALELELRKAMELQQFHLYYQVQVNSAGQPFGAEALIRWLHLERGMISPFHFIPLLEETGLILPVGLWVLETACAQLKAWQNSPQTRDLTLSINVSPKQFHQHDFVAQVKSAIEKNQINPSLLKLELTEGILLNNIEETIFSMIALKALGVYCALDDFGTGYSSLQYLKRLPLDQLKIDQSFVQDLVGNDQDKTIVSTIIAMASNLKMNVIAEGVETVEQKQILLDKGCAHFQGYLYSKPLPIEQFVALVCA